MGRSYPKDSVQYYVEPWWQRADSNVVSVGRLVWVLAVHMEQIPMRLVVEGREEPTDHRRALYRIEPFSVSTRRDPRPKIPVAALPDVPDESRVVSRAKRRPALVLSTPGPSIESALIQGKSKWQAAPTLTVAPFYGTTQTEKRAGFDPVFVQRIRRAMYPHLLWDLLPIDDKEESVMMFSQVQSVGAHQQAIELTPWELSTDALEVVLDWWRWYQVGQIPMESILGDARTGIVEVVKLPPPTG